MTLLRNLVRYALHAEPAVIVGAIGTALSALVFTGVIDTATADEWQKTIGGAIQAVTLWAVRSQVYAKRTVDRLTEIRDAFSDV